MKEFVSFLYRVDSSMMFALSLINEWRKFNEISVKKSCMGDNLEV